ncbi:TolC family protein [Bacteroides faecichinchillae]|uniref:Outer membrane protein TolC n=1 Tax=Bacteroides faecichinchillae TaxID=871325 RepID=A0A1M4ZBF0_9BACE|nr:TolC family protein [Bacteroides faecichinchillae]THG68316.1 TolC family protein [Bacteroides faecichinchillae]SHF15373.1 Outer membrane protein TolC [Bacteroides faecichinchillae]
MQSDLQLLKRMLLSIVIFMGLALPSQGQIPLTIDKAMEIAQENSPSLRSSHMNLERYKQNLLAQKASLKSKFSLDLMPVSYSKDRSFDNYNSKWYTGETFNTNGTFKIDQPILWTDGTISLINKFGWQDNSSIRDDKKDNSQVFSNNLYLQLSQPIFTYNKRKMELKQIEYDYENANISYALQRLNTEKSITDQFYAVYMAQSNLEISREELVNVQQSYEIKKNKVEADLAAKDELYQAELNLATARSSVDERQVSLENAKDKLKQTLGMNLDEDILVFAEVDIKPIQVNLEQAITHGLGSRLELRQREIKTKELEFDMIKTKAMNEFKGDISVSFGLTGDNKNLNKMFDNPTQNPRVSVSFSVPIFDWGEKKARIKAQQIAQQINELEFHEEKVDIELNIRQVWRSLENLRTQIKIAEQNVKNAQLTYDLNQTRYREGDITGMEMSQFQTQLSNQKIAYTQSLINYRIELLNLKILSLYDFDTNSPIVPMKDMIDKK